MNKKLFITLVFVVFVVWDTMAQGCSQCTLIADQASKTTDMNSIAFTTNINKGILLLMLLPYFLVMFLFRKQIIAFFKEKFGKKDHSTASDEL